MKKFIFLLMASGSFIMCKKGETVQSHIDNAVKKIDSVASESKEAANTIDNAAQAILDSSSIKIKDFNDKKEEIKEKFETTSKLVDSLKDKISSVKLESQTKIKDSSAVQSKKNNTAPQVVKETQIIYREKPEKKDPELSIPIHKMVKTGTIELSVDNWETAKEAVKEEIRKYDGYIKSENFTSNNNDQKIAYLKVKVPIQKFDYLMDALSYNIGNVESKGVDISGQDFVNNTFCDMEITLYAKTSADAASEKDKSFGEKSFDAISSGWNVITSIFLFLLPFWPLFLIGGIGYYFYKKKNPGPKNDSNIRHDKHQHHS
ncbi:DUF4349 domain-containing protein [Chryseobacterium sp. CT-SW4]|uniref:DUF4349 domain-containing protein n=1 Tax=Chryseobacterium sp. SW-1 TaxID=3157343 RepID=UPI003B015D04